MKLSDSMCKAIADGIEGLKVERATVCDPKQPGDPGRYWVFKFDNGTELAVRLMAEIGNE